MSKRRDVLYNGYRSRCELHLSTVQTFCLQEASNQKQSWIKVEVPFKQDELK